MMQLTIDIPDKLISQLRDVEEMERNDGIWAGSVVPTWARARATQLGLSSGSYQILTWPATRLAMLVLEELDRVSRRSSDGSEVG